MFNGCRMVHEYFSYFNNHTLINTAKLLNVLGKELFFKEKRIRIEKKYIALD